MTEIEMAADADTARDLALSGARKLALEAMVEHIEANPDMGTAAFRKDPKPFFAAWLSTLREYEALRGWAREPREEVHARFKANGPMITAYERARALTMTMLGAR